TSKERSQLDKLPIESPVGCLDGKVPVPICDRPRESPVTDLMPLLGYDAIEFYVGNARQAAHYYRTAFGFDVVAYAGPETGVRDRSSYVLQQGEIRFVMTAGLGPESAIVQHQASHGDGIRDVAFLVPDAEAAFDVAVSRGARPAREPESV